MVAVRFMPIKGFFSGFWNAGSFGAHTLCVPRALGF
uniref:Uncharacterized protein n=1 Tax=Anguilla anguilla TaxID=7936 RepID=A0A0E9PCH5_ANGAN